MATKPTPTPVAHWRAAHKQDCSRTSPDLKIQREKSSSTVSLAKLVRLIQSPLTNEQREKLTLIRNIARESSISDNTLRRLFAAAGRPCLMLSYFTTIINGKYIVPHYHLCVMTFCLLLFQTGIEWRPQDLVYWKSMKESME